MVRSFCVEVKDVAGVWTCNGFMFATAGETRAFGLSLVDLYPRITEWRVSPSPEPVNYQWMDGRATPIKVNDVPEM